MTTSARSANSATILDPEGVPRSMTTLRLLRFMPMNSGPSPCSSNGGPR